MVSGSTIQVQRLEGGCSSGVEGLRSKGEGGILLAEGNCELL